MLFLTDVDHVSFEKANETRQNNLQSATMSLQVVIGLCKRKETAALKIKATASWACECVCFTTAFFLLPSCGRLFHIYETWCFANIWREKPAPIPKKINAVGIAHIAYSIPLLICSTDRSETARTW